MTGLIRRHAVRHNNPRRILLENGNHTALLAAFAAMVLALISAFTRRIAATCTVNCVSGQVSTRLSQSMSSLSLIICTRSSTVQVIEPGNSSCSSSTNHGFLFFILVLPARPGGPFCFPINYQLFAINCSPSQLMQLLEGQLAQPLRLFLGFHRRRHPLPSEFRQIPRIRQDPPLRPFHRYPSGLPFLRPRPGLLEAFSDVGCFFPSPLALLTSHLVARPHQIFCERLALTYRQLRMKFFARRLTPEFFLRGPEPGNLPYALGDAQKFIRPTRPHRVDHRIRVRVRIVPIRHYPAPTPRLEHRRAIVAIGLLKFPCPLRHSHAVPRHLAHRERRPIHPLVSIRHLRQRRLLARPLLPRRRSPQNLPVITLVQQTLHRPCNMLVVLV